MTEQTTTEEPVREVLAPGHNRTTYASFSHFLDYVEQGPKQYEAWKDYTGKRKPWPGTHTFPQAMALARGGWAKGREEVEKLASQIEAVSGQFATRPMARYDVSGGAVDVARFLAGEPECMIEWEEEVTAAKGRVVTLLVDCFFSADITHEAIIRRGAAIVALIDALENAGRSCELVLVYALGSYGKDVHETVVPLKKAGEMLEVDRLAFMLAHPATFRRLMFASGEREPSEVRANYGYRPESSFYGTPSKPKMEADVKVPQIGGLDNAGLLKWISDELKKQGIEVTTAQGGDAIGDYKGPEQDDSEFIE